jgi:hypothetical protein
MKRILFFIFLQILIAKSFAQVDANTKFKPIPFSKTKLKIKPQTPQKLDVEPLEISPILKPKTQSLTTKRLSPLAKNDSISMIPPVKLGNLGDAYINKMSKDLDKTLHEGDAPLIRTNADFGEIRTKSKYFIVKYRDYIQVDGDLVKVTLNNQPFVKQFEMEGDYKEFRIDFNEGINLFETEALNTGTSGGNTAEFQIYDAKGKFIGSIYWNNLATGVKGKLLIIKE